MFQLIGKVAELQPQEKKCRGPYIWEGRGSNMNLCKSFRKERAWPFKGLWFFTMTYADHSRACGSRTKWIRFLEGN